MQTNPTPVGFFITAFYTRFLSSLVLVFLFLAGATMTAFESALKFVLKHEGGYVNNPNDTGGETNFGISDRRDGVVDGKADLNGDLVPDVAIKDLKQEQAAIVYNREYWTPCKCEQLHPAVALILQKAPF